MKKSMEVGTGRDRNSKNNWREEIMQNAQQNAAKNRQTHEENGAKKLKRKTQRKQSWKTVPLILAY